MELSPSTSLTLMFNIKPMVKTPMKIGYEAREKFSDKIYTEICIRMVYLQSNPFFPALQKHCLLHVLLVHI